MRPNVDSKSPESEDYKISFEEYKILLGWANKIADRRQETSNLFFGVSGAILTVIILALTQLKDVERLLALVFAAIVGIIVSAMWATLLQRYKEILYFKYEQLKLFEEVLGLGTSGLVSAEDDFFRLGKPLAAYGKTVTLARPSKIGKFGITLAERNLSLILLLMFISVLLITVAGYLF